MENLRHIKVLDDILWDQYIVDIVNPLTKVYINDKGFEHSHVVLYGRSTFITRMIARKHVIGSKKYDKLNFSFIDDTYKSFLNPQFIEIDLNLVNQKTIIDILKPIFKTRSISNLKHKILIHNICFASKNLQFALRKMIETYSENVYIIFTAEKLDSLEVSLKSRLTLINCNVKIHKPVVYKLIEKCRPDIDKNIYDEIILKSNNDYVNLAIILELENPLDYTDLISGFVNDSIDKLLELTKLEYENCLREICYKISAICIDIKSITSVILKRDNLSNYQLHEIVQLASKVDYEINPSNKIFFSLEMYFSRIIQIIKN